MAQRRFLLLLGILTLARWSAGVIQCYTCVSTVNELTCVEDPDNVPNGSPITDCDMGDRECCTIFRQEYLEEPGKVISFSRGCQPNCPSKMETIKVEDASYRIFQTFCDTPRCNTGPGDQALGGGWGGGGGGGGIIGPVPGLEDGANSVSISLVLMASGLLVLLLRA